MIKPSADLVDGCAHPRAQHRHGTYAAYARCGCRCDACVQAKRRRGKVNRCLPGRGLVDAQEARSHVNALLDAGLTLAQIEQRSGVNRAGLYYLLGQAPGRPAARRIRATSAQAILAVRADLVGDETSGLVDSTGTRRRLQALVASGWPLYVLAGRAGLSRENIWKRLGVTPTRVSTRDAVRRLYNELWDADPIAHGIRPQSVTKARARGLREGWPPPLAWDDDTIDDPAARPAGMRPAHKTRGTTEAEVMDLLDMGETVDAIAQRLRISTSGVYQVVARARARARVA